MEDEYVELKDIEKDRRKKEFEEFSERARGGFASGERTPKSSKSMGEFFARMKRGYIKGKELVKEYKYGQERKQMFREQEKEVQFEKYKRKAEQQIAFGNLQARRLKAKASA